MLTPQEERTQERKVHSALSDYLHRGSWKTLEDGDQEAVTAVLKIVLDASFKELGTSPADLDDEQLREVLLDFLPRRCPDRQKTRDLALAIVRDFFKSLGGDELLEKHKSVWKDAEKMFSSEAVKKLEPIKAETAPGRNDPCPCGSGKKYKKCCGSS